MKYDINNMVFELLFDEPFFSALSRQIPKVAVDFIPTMAVQANKNGDLRIIYNQEFIDSLNPLQIKGVLKHEFYHLIFNHVTSRFPSPNKQKQWNYATDLSINCWIKRDELPENVLVPGEGVFEKLPRDQSAEYYFEHLPQEVLDYFKELDEMEEKLGELFEEWAKENPDKYGQFDGHNWKEISDPNVSDMVKQKIRMMVKKAVQRAAVNHWGSVPNHIQGPIIDSIKVEINPEKLLEYFVKTTLRANKVGSIKKINKRYPYLFPGKKIKRLARIAISIDQSGSVDDGLLSQFFGVISKFAKFASFDIIPFDTEVLEDDIFTWEKGKKIKAQRVRCGGTCFDAPTKYVNEKGYDGHIILTDMGAPKPIPSKCRRIWITSQEYKHSPYFRTDELVVAFKVAGE